LTTFEWIIGLLLASVVLSALARLMQAEGNPDGGVTATELPADPSWRRALAAARRAELGAQG
jgi:hypothetical protein